MPVDSSTPLGALLSAVLFICGAGGLVGLITAVRGWRTDRWGNESTLVQRLNEDSKQQGARADREERGRRLWEDQAGRYRRQIVASGMTPDDTVWMTGTDREPSP